MVEGPASGSGQGNDPARGPVPDRTPPQDKHSAEQRSAGKRSADKQGTDRPGADKQGTDRPGADKRSADRPGADKRSAGGPGGGKPGAGGPGGGRMRGPGSRLARGFGKGGPLDGALPGAALIQKLDRACGPGRECGGGGADEAFGMLGRWEASEAWCASGKLGVIRTLIGHRAQPGYEPATPGGLPGVWQPGLTQEVSNELGISLRAADALIGLACTLHTRLPLTSAALDTGALSLAKARIIAEATSVLDDGQAAAAEALIAGLWAGKTPGQIAKMIAWAVVKTDPEGARKRREKAQREDARVRFWREYAGTAALAAFGLPPDEALAANQRIQDRALLYKAAGVPGTLDQLRVRAFLDIINGTDSRPPPDATPDTGADTTRQSRHDGNGNRPDGPDGNGPDPDRNENRPDEPDQDGNRNGPDEPDPDRNENGPDKPDQDGNGPDPDEDGPDRGGDGDGDGPGGAGGDPPAGTGGPGGRGGAAPVAANIALTIPLMTMLGLAQNPGDAHGLGAIDPDLARQLATAAARNPRSRWCVTVTDQQGHAIGHGCAKLAGKRKPRPDRTRDGTRDGPSSFTKTAGHDPPGDGYGTWRLQIAGRDFTVTLIPIPVTECDHRYETASYRPSTLLRHLVEVRDGQCTQPTCVRDAPRCDFEHATPWHKGGKTCACNTGCRCRRDHRVKQSPGWTVTQPMPGYHQWTTPSGRTFTTEPMRYPI
jgi:uncharacterized protein DUF222